RNARSKHIRSRDDGSIREPELRVLERFAVRLTLLILFAISELDASSRCQLLMTLEIAESGTEFAGSRFPDQRCRDRIEAVIQLRCTNPERAQVIANHGNIVELLCEFSPSPNAR